MTTEATRYELVFFGTDLQGTQRTEAFNTLARLMKIEPDQVEQVLEKRGGIIARALRSEVGDQAHRKLMSIGIRCNLRPYTVPGVEMELVPMEKPTTVVTCPACGHVYRVKGDEQIPTICGNCGTVFAKYNRVAAEKEERERVREALLAKHQRLLDQQRKEGEDREARERRQRLEEEIRKELGLPRMITSRTRLISSAAGIYLLGLAMGAGGLLGYGLHFGYNLHPQSGSIPPPPAPSASGGLAAMIAAAEAGLPIGTLDPGVVAQMQIAELFSALRRPEAAAPTTTPGASGLPTTAHEGPSRPSTAPSTSFLDGRLADLKIDAEWDIYVLGQIDALQDRGATTQAAALVAHLRKPERRFDRGARLARSLWREGKPGAAEKLYLHLSTAAEELQGGPTAQVEALCTLARHIAEAGRQAEAEALLGRAKIIAATITGPADRAKADIEMAALLTNLGDPQGARALFQVAMRELSRIDDPAERLTAVARLALGYAKAGYRASALNLLEHATNNIHSVKDERQRTRVLAVVAVTYGRLTDMQAAKVTAQRIASPADRDRALYRIVIEEIVSDRLANAINVTEDLTTPAYRALAFGLLGLRQNSQPAYRALAAQSSERAIAASASVKDSPEKSAVLAEIGRFAARDGDTTAANRYFADSHDLAGSTSSALDRESAFAILATNEALALRFSDARLTLAKIANTQLGHALAGDLEDLEKAEKAAEVGRGL